MRTLTFAAVVAAATALAAADAHATLAPELELEVGPVASTPVTTGSISILGVTVEGAPLIGSTAQKIMQLNGTVTSGTFNPLGISATEFNLTGLGRTAMVSAAISGTLAPMSSVSWSVYLDAGNDPLGTGTLIASRSFSDPSSDFSLGFSDPVAAIPVSVNGPFALTEFVTVSAPNGETVTFNSSATARFAVPEPASLAVLASGLLGLGLFAPMRRTRKTP